MMSITAKELDAKVEAYEESDYNDPWKEWKWQEGLPADLGDGVVVTRLAAEYGGEGQGEQYWIVVEVESSGDTQLFRKDGYYASYDGGYLDGDTYEVEPVEVTVIEYKEKTNG